MRAAVVSRYGPPENVSVVEIPLPTVRAHDVLVRVAATTVTTGDSRIRGARFPRGFGVFARLGFGVSGPRRRILGGTFAGVVESIGSEVRDIAVGDRVSGMSGVRLGAHAQFISVPASTVLKTPPGVSDEDAAAMLFGGTTALYFLRDLGSVKPGDTVLVNGASGAVGTNAVQLAKYFGATVSAVASAPNHALLRRIGADRVIDYTATPITELEERFDVVLDTVGTLTPTAGKRLLTPDGVLLLAVADLWQTLRSRGQVKSGAAPERPADMALLLELMATGRLVAVTDVVIGLDDIVAAHRRVDSGRKVGNLVVLP